MDINFASNTLMPMFDGVIKCMSDSFYTYVHF